jgi:hypothetical protein
MAKRLFVMREAHTPVVTATQLTRDFGVFANDRGETYVRAIVHYAGAAHQFDWPLTVWNKVADGFIPASWTQFIRPVGEPAASIPK